MPRYQVKLILTAVVFVLISEIVKRYAFAHGLMMSVPGISVLAIMWFYDGSEEAERETGFAGTIFWLAFPAIFFFLLLNLLRQNGYGFYVSYSFAAATMVTLYAAMFRVMRLLRVRI